MMENLNELSDALIGERLKLARHSTRSGGVVLVKFGVHFSVIFVIFGYRFGSQGFFFLIPMLYLFALVGTTYLAAPDCLLMDT